MIRTPKIVVKRSPQIPVYAVWLDYEYSSGATDSALITVRIDLSNSCLDGDILLSIRYYLCTAAHNKEYWIDKKILKITNIVKL